MQENLSEKDQETIDFITKRKKTPPTAAAATTTSSNDPVVEEPVTVKS